MKKSRINKAISYNRYEEKNILLLSLLLMDINLQ